MVYAPVLRVRKEHDTDQQNKNEVGHSDSGNRGLLLLNEFFGRLNGEGNQPDEATDRTTRMH